MSSRVLPGLTYRLNALSLSPQTVNSTSVRHSYGALRPGFVHPNPLNQPRQVKVKFRPRNFNPLFKRERAKKMQKIELPDFNETSIENMTPAERKERMKKIGMQPVRPWQERPIFVASTSATMEPYIPPEGDGKAPLMSTEMVKEKSQILWKKGKTRSALKTIRKYEEDFDVRNFGEQATKIYKDLHEAIASPQFDKNEVLKLATERVYSSIIKDLEHKQIKWTYVKALEPPRIIQARTAPAMTEGNLFGQITVRFNTQQTLAIYDRFGRLMHGSEALARDVLEYVVFEKHISNVYGIWRVHEKIVPNWMKVRPASYVTFKKEEPPPEEPENSTEGTSKEEPPPAAAAAS